MGVRLPRWARAGLVMGVVALTTAAALMGYRYVTRPVTLTVASGSLDGEAVRFLTAIAGRLASSGSNVRLKVVDAGTSLNAAKTFAAGGVDLAVVRADSPDLSAARSVVLFTYGVVMIIVPSGSTIEDVDDLKGK